MAKDLTIKERVKELKRLAAPTVRPMLVSESLKLFGKGAAKPQPFMRVLLRNGYWSVDLGITGVVLGSDTNDRAEVQRLADEINAHAEIWFAKRYRELLGQRARVARKHKVMP